jgi:ubiquitin
VSDIELELHVDDEFAASVSGPRENAFAEMRRYWSQYASDGKCTVYEVTRKQIPIDAVLGLAQETSVVARTCKLCGWPAAYGDTCRKCEAS